MTTYGLTADGFVPKTLEVIRTEIDADAREAFGQSVKLGDDSALGKLIGIFAERFVLLWEQTEVVNNWPNPDNATGAELEAVCALTGTVKNGATYSTVTETLTGTPTTIVGSGSIVRVDGTTTDFETTAAATIGALNAWVAATAYTVGLRVTNASRAYICITAGTSAGAGGPTTTAADITDGTVHWRYLGEGIGAVDVEMQAEADTGPTAAPDGTLTDVQTVVAGWDSAINLDDADLGTNIETDEALRIRRESELAQAGATTVDAIRAAFLEVSDVTAVDMFLNNTDTVDGDGMPAHSVEAMVQGGADQDLWDAVLGNVAAGIATTGTDPGTSVDSEGKTHTVSFSRPVEVPIYVIVDVDVDLSIYPSDGDAQIATAIATWPYPQEPGKDAVANAVSAAAMSIAGVLDVTSLDMQEVDPPVGTTTVAIDTRHLATYDSGDVDVTSSGATP